ncbi:hypothetical protein HanLR1_Chr05g0172561 [Helianthus annuus]|nr:hypothetical protein HanLR1_Chr05g0172561 [Helianthus annuus]
MKQSILVAMVHHKSRSRTTGVVSPKIGRLMTRSPKSKCTHTPDGAIFRKEVAHKWALSSNFQVRQLDRVRC